MRKRLCEAEIGRHRWIGLHTLGDRSEQVPDALRRMVSGETEEEVMEAYWDLENTVVVQGQLFDSALPVLSVLLAALTEEISVEARDAVVELIHQIVSGESDEEEVERGNPDLGPRCRELAREGLWLLYRELGTRRRENAEAILEAIDPDGERLAVLRSSVRGKSAPR
ncbi:hypothetical protein [Streptomyces barkulensis]|uniref:hypothetical protein n=2 Tax=Streptomyces barkulensis TaxID=1257026 RepID=UPI000C6EEAC5|nr:hypothetical protein [Streptomyces barkulensis]